MKYVIMCGGEYKNFKIPKPLNKIKGEKIIERTIRLLKENNINEIYISSNNPIFDNFGVKRIEHRNTYKYDKEKAEGYWLDAFYPFFDENDKVCYIFGDVYFTKQAIKTIVDYQTEKNILFGTGLAKNEFHNDWGEPFAYKVNDYKSFLNGIKQVKKLQDKGKTKRVALVWELYRYLNNLDINIQQIKDETYICIDDGTIDVDSPEQVEMMNNV